MDEAKHNYAKYIPVVAVVLLLGIGIFAFVKGIPGITGYAVKEGSSQQNPSLDTNNDGKTTQLSKESFSESAQSDLINNIISLRTATNNDDLVEIASYYSKIDDVLRDSSIANSWSDVADCSYNSCEEKKYLDLIDAVVSLNLDSDKNDKIHSLIETYYLWNSKNEALFSKSLTRTNGLFLDEDADVKNAWSEMISCNGCSDMTDDAMNVIYLLEN